MNKDCKIYHHGRATKEFLRGSGQQKAQGRVHSTLYSNLDCDGTYQRYSVGEGNC